MADTDHQRYLRQHERKLVVFRGLWYTDYKSRFKKHHIIILHGAVISVFNLHVNKLNIGLGFPADVENLKNPI